MSEKTKNIILSFASLLIVFLVIVALGVDIFHAIEEILYDHQATVLSNSAFSRLTNKVNLFCGVLSLILLPYYVTKIFDENFEIPRFLYRLKFIASVLITLVFVAVIFLLFPFMTIAEGIEEAVKANFLGDCLYTHLLIPALFVFSYLLLDQRHEVSRTAKRAVWVILVYYVIIYALFVFALKTWEDFYYVGTIIEYATVWCLPLLFVLILLAARFVANLYSKVKKEKIQEIE